MTGRAVVVSVTVGITVDRAVVGAAVDDAGETTAIAEETAGAEEAADELCATEVGGSG